MLAFAPSTLYTRVDDITEPKLCFELKPTEIGQNVTEPKLDSKPCDRQSADLASPSLMNVLHSDTDSSGDFEVNRVTSQSGNENEKAHNTQSAEPSLFQTLAADYQEVFQSSINTSFIAKISAHLLYCDIVGPLPVSNDHRYLLTIVYRFSRWFEALPLRDITVKSCADTFVLHFVARYGTPHAIIVDRETQFNSTLWKELTKFLDCELTLCGPIFFPKNFPTGPNFFLYQINSFPCSMVHSFQCDSLLHTAQKSARISPNVSSKKLVTRICAFSIPRMTLDLL